MTGGIVLHVGTHKTGTTSLQQFLADQNVGLLADAGITYPPGLVIPNSHAELPLLAIRPERFWPARLRLPETQEPAWLSHAEAHVRDYVSRPGPEVLVFSHEDLSYLRFDDELERLRDLLGNGPVRVIVFLRDKAAFLRSYRLQLEATGFPLSTDPSSFAYVEDDSWLIDHGALLAGYRRWFGRQHVDVIDYDATMAADGSVIPAFAEQIGIDRANLPNIDQYFVNQTGSQFRLTPEQLAATRRRLKEQAP